MRLKWSHVYRYYELLEPFLKVSTPLEALPGGENILVIAPHIDDETIGCGGTIAKHAHSGKNVTVLFAADCSEERKKEGNEAAAILGIKRLIFWDYQSKTLDRFPEISGRLNEVIKEVSPDIVYLPSWLDRHNDHMSLNRYFYETLKMTDFDFMIYGYEVWTAMIPNIIVDISEQAENKKRALLCYRSQLKGRDWIEGTLALNRYRGVIAGAKSHGEAFFRSTPAQFKKFWERLHA